MRGIVFVFLSLWGSLSVAESFCSRIGDKFSAPGMHRDAQHEFLVNHLDEAVRFINTQSLPLVEEGIMRSLRLGYAVSVNQGDLFHSHLRVPLGLNKFEKVDDLLGGSSSHIQFHSFERIGVLKSIWASEIMTFSNREMIREWAQQRIAWKSRKAPPDLTELNETEIGQLAELWRKSSKIKLPIQNFVWRVRMLNRFDIEAIERLLENRSYILFDDRLESISGLDCGSFWQPFNPSFDEVSRYSGLTIAEGDILFNPTHPHYSKINGKFRTKGNQEKFERVFESLRNGGPSSTFNYVFRDDIERDTFLYLYRRNDFIYAVSFP